VSAGLESLVMPAAAGIELVKIGQRGNALAERAPI
jgi:hypothetical protein